MQRLLLGTATALIIGLSTGNLSAQALRNADEPAEFPPASYTGKQYVDSKGCVFVRAGFDGAVTWVPRVSRKRTVLCGFEPSLSGSQVATAAPAPAPEPKPEPIEIIVATPEPAKPAPAPAANPRPAASTPRVVAAAPAPRVTTPVVRVQPPRQVAPVVSTQPVRVATPRVMTPRPGAAARVASACANASATSQIYLRTANGHVVRCGPQGDHPGAYALSGTAYAPTGGAILRVPPAPEIKPPAGYRAAFEDDRFNPNRGKQTREGFAQMRLIWTAGVPRRLVDQNTGRDVTSLFPGLRFPFLSFKQQRRYVAVNTVESADTTYRISTKNAPAPVSAVPERVTSVPAGHRYVQIGTFSDENSARATATRLKSMGLPARLGTYQKAGKVYRIVLTGPFANASQLANGLTAARRAGFPGAYTRK